MELSILDFGLAKQFFRRTAFFMAFDCQFLMFLAVFFRYRIQSPLPIKFILQTKFGLRKENLAADHAIQKVRWLPNFLPCNICISLAKFSVLSAGFALLIPIVNLEVYLVSKNCSKSQNGGFSQIFLVKYVG